MSFTPLTINYPADVPNNRRAVYRKNWQLLTKGTGNLLLLAGDQRIEHLNDDFFGPGITPDNNDPEYFFKISQHLSSGAIAVHYGLASRYGAQYHQANYVIKLNSKTNLPVGDPDSYNLAQVDQAIKLSKRAGFNLVGVGYTIYLGSKYEGRMLAEASEVIRQAHEQGLVVVLWIYPKGSKVKNENSTAVIAGASGVAISLGADFVKVKSPKPLTIKNIQRITQAAGLTRVVFAGGSNQSADKFFTEVAIQLKGGSAGLAVGRNIHQHPLAEAKRRLKVLESMIYDGKPAPKPRRSK